MEYSFSQHYKIFEDLKVHQANLEDSLFTSQAFIKGMHQSLNGKIKFLYIVFFKDSDIVGYSVIQRLYFNGQLFNMDALELPLKNIAKKIIAKQNYNLWLCGNLFATGPYGVVHQKRPATNKENNYATLDNALKTIQKTLQEKPTFLLYKESYPVKKSTKKNTTSILQQLGYRIFTINPNLILKIDPSWKKQEDYLNAMKTKYRSRIKTTEKQSQSIRSENFTAEQIEKYSKDIENLYLQVINRAFFKLSRFEKTSFIALKKELKNNYVFTAYFLEEELIGFSSSFIGQLHIEASHVGYKITCNRKYAIYQRMLLDYVKLSIELQKEKLLLGRSSDTIKSSYGAQPVTMEVGIKHRSPFWSFILSPLLKCISLSQKEIRNPFKISSQNSSKDQKIKELEIKSVF